MELVNNSPRDIDLYNSTIEVGMRLLFVLEAFSPSNLSLKELRIFDYLTVHTQDIGGPESLHPSLPDRIGEYLIRHKKIGHAIDFLHRNHLLQVNYDKNGLRYSSSERGSSLLSLTAATYHNNLRERTHWLSTNAKQQGIQVFTKVHEEHILAQCLQRQ